VGGWWLNSVGKARDPKAENLLAKTNDAATLTEVFPCFFLGCKANARVQLPKTGHGPHSSKIVALFYVLFVLYRSMYCLCVNVYYITATG
jgi:heme/copper-type cytochrome/quinol oxidase subunit 3